MNKLSSEIKDKSRTVSLLFFSVLVAYHAAQFTFRNGYEYYPYFLAVGAVIFSIKVFSTGYSTIFHSITKKTTTGVLLGTGFIISQLWLLDACIKHLQESFYPQNPFRTLLLVSGIFSLQQIIYPVFKGTISRLTPILYYGAVYVFLYYGIPDSFDTLLTLQIVSVLVPLVELWQLKKTFVGIFTEDLK